MKLLFFLMTLWSLNFAFAQTGAKCAWDSDCPTGYMCADEQCRMGKWPDGGCTWDSDCNTGYECKNGECSYKTSALPLVLKKLIAKSCVGGK
jgi:hypothetical protein